MTHSPKPTSFSIDRIDETPHGLRRKTIAFVKTLSEAKAWFSTRYGVAFEWIEDTEYSAADCILLASGTVYAIEPVSDRHTH